MLILSRMTGTDRRSQRQREKWGEAIRDARLRLGLTTTQLGALVGTSAQTIWNWESGKSAPRPHHQAALAQALQVPWHELFVPIELAIADEGAA